MKNRRWRSPNVLRSCSRASSGRLCLSNHVTKRKPSHVLLLRLAISLQAAPGSKSHHICQVAARRTDLPGLQTLSTFPFWSCVSKMEELHDLEALRRENCVGSRESASALLTCIRLVPRAATSFSNRFSTVREAGVASVEPEDGVIQPAWSECTGSD